jgi:hypothetical protein
MLPSALDVLQNANTIELLVGISGRAFEGRIAAVGTPLVEIRYFVMTELTNAASEFGLAGDPEPYPSHLIQPLSALKSPSRRSCVFRGDTDPQKGRHRQLSPQTVRSTDSVRLRAFGFARHSEVVSLDLPCRSVALRRS